MSTYLSISTTKEGLIYLAGVQCAEKQRIFIEELNKVGKRVAKTYLKEFETCNSNILLRIQSGKRIYLLTFDKLLVFNLDLELMRVYYIQGINNVNYSKPIFRTPKCLYLGIGIDQKFSFSTFIYSRFTDVPQATLFCLY
jgi:hypothetical protein